MYKYFLIINKKYLFENIYMDIELPIIMKNTNHLQSCGF